MRYSDCHPDRKHFAKGFCEACYARNRRKDPIIKAKQYETNRKWLSKHPDYERLRSSRRWETNKVNIIAYKKEWFAKNPGKMREYKNNWKKANVESYLLHMRADVKKRKALKKGAKISDFTAKQWEQLKKDHDGRCSYCGVESELTQDHVIPLSKGGNHTLSNIVPACIDCNIKKSNRPVEEFLANVATL